MTEAEKRIRATLAEVHADTHNAAGLLHLACNSAAMQELLADKDATQAKIDALMFDTAPTK